MITWPSQAKPWKWKSLLHLLKERRLPPNSFSTDVPQHTPTSGPQKGRLPPQPTVHSHYPHPVPLSYWLSPLSNQTRPRINTGYFPAKLSFTTTYLWRWNRQSVPKRRLLIFRRRGNTQNKIYLIYNTAKVWKLRYFKPFIWNLMFYYL
jgi:hypothetical protein